MSKLSFRLFELFSIVHEEVDHAKCILLQYDIFQNMFVGHVTETNALCKSDSVHVMFALRDVYLCVVNIA